VGGNARAITVGVMGRRTPPLGDVQAEDTPVRFSPRGLENPLITMTF